MDILTILLIILVAVVVYGFFVYNGLVTAKVRVDQSWKDIDIQLKKRYDLLPDLVETAKKASALDEKILLEVTRLRAEGLKAAEQGANHAERGKIEGQISSMMRDVKVAVENYPDIKAHGELSKLMEMVSDIEEKIAYSRQFYNSNAGDFNTKILLFPNIVFANLLGFRSADYFQASEEERKDIKVNLG